MSPGGAHRLLMARPERPLRVAVWLYPGHLKTPYYAGMVVVFSRLSTHPLCCSGRERTSRHILVGNRRDHGESQEAKAQKDRQAQAPQALEGDAPQEQVISCRLRATTTFSRPAATCGRGSVSSAMIATTHPSFSKWLLQLAATPGCAPVRDTSTLIEELPGLSAGTAPAEAPTLIDPPPDPDGPARVPVKPGHAGERQNSRQTAPFNQP